MGYGGYFSSRKESVNQCLTSFRLLKRNGLGKLKNVNSLLLILKSFLLNVT